VAAHNSAVQYSSSGTLVAVAEHTVVVDTVAVLAVGIVAVGTVAVGIVAAQIAAVAHSARQPVVVGTPRYFRR